MKTIIAGLILLLSLPSFGQISITSETDKVLKVGEKAPDFSLKNATGKEVRLSDLLKEGPVVLTWYRGSWCPYCNRNLNDWQKHLGELKKQGANLIALTAEVPDKSMTTQEKNHLQFEVLSDINLQVGRKYGVVFTLQADLASKYESSFKLSEYNGNEKGELPIPAIFVIDKTGIIQYVYANPDYKVRANPETVLEELRKIK